MRSTDEHLKATNTLINSNIEKIEPDNVGFYASNILNVLRNFVETVVVKLSGNTNYSYDIFNDVKGSIFSQGKYKFLKDFHALLQKSMSHYTEIGENATRLIFKYYEYLLRIKKLFQEEFNIELLSNLYKLEEIINADKDLKEYYEKVVNVIETPTSYKKSLNFNDVYYIDKVKPFFIEENIYYEITFRLANDYTSKFDRIIAFTDQELLSNYAVKFKIDEDYIEIFDKLISIKIIKNYEISIRPCEFKNLSKILFGNSQNITRNNEYKNLMNFLKKEKLNLLDVVLLNNKKYSLFKNLLANNAKNSFIRDILDKCRVIIINKKSGANISRYLLFIMNNQIIKKFYANESNNKLSNLYITNRAIPFERIPFSFFPPNHTPRLIDLLRCIDNDGREDELFARLIRNNSEIKGMLYTSKSEIKSFEQIDNLVHIYNNKLYDGHRPEADIKGDKGQIYIYKYELEVIKILEKLKELLSQGIDGYSNSVRSWMESKGENYFDDPIKKEALINMFQKSSVAFIYGSAGTGKTKLIEYITEYFKDRTTQISMLFLANTHTALNNLKRRIGHISNADFGTVKKYTNQNNVYMNVLIIDECSTISNEDMLKILNNINFELLVLVGDIHQIEAIRFGNWFYLAKKFFQDVSTELIKTRRTHNKELLDFWNAVRNLEDTIEERISRNNFAKSLDSSIFERIDEDEIVLCLNYGGLYGINNINMLLQQANDNPEVKWGIYTFKVGDPVIFNEIGRFDDILYNNLKGVIKNIKIEKINSRKRIVFEVEIEKTLTSLEVRGTDIEFIKNNERGSIISFYVYEIGSLDDDSNELKDDIIPFQIAYALSIHKAQGLEYNSVKVIITDEVEEQITHSIFYTAITRAKEKLTIYWSPQTQKKILENLKYGFCDKDFHILKQKIYIREKNGQH